MSPTKPMSTSASPTPPVVTQDDGLGGQEELDMAMLKHWGRVLATWDVFVRKNRRRLHEMLEAGIPDPIRGMVWQRLAEMAVPDQVRLAACGVWLRWGWCAARPCVTAAQGRKPVTLPHSSPRPSPTHTHRERERERERERRG